MEDLLHSLGQLFYHGGNVLIALLAFLLPWTPLAAWVAFWLFAVNWTKLHELLFKRGGIVAVLLIGFTMILIWGLIAPSGSHEIFGLALSNFVGKTVYVTGLFCIMFLCGSVQLSGCCASCCKFDEPAAESEHHVNSHH